jgi:FlgD Ig-like domain
LPRFFSVLVVVFLLGGTAAAFAVTQGLKLERSPVLSPRIDKVFAPGVNEAQIAFTVRERDRVSLAIVDGDGAVVRTIVAGTRFPGRRITATWDGRDDSGRIVPDGDYRPRVRLADARRTIVFPNEMRVDTERPRIARFSVSRRTISPDGDGRADGVSIAYELSERASMRLLVNGKQRVRKLGQAPVAAIQWYGKLRGRPVRPRTYRLELVAVDDAGNRSRRVFAAPVRVRYVELGPDTIRARAGTRFGARVSTDARRYAWLFARGRGSSSARYLVLRAPRQPGRYRLFVQALGRGDSARVVVTPPR